MRRGFTVSPAVCAGGCGASVARNVARKRGWKSKGPQQRRAWYCPSCPLPPEPAPPPAEPISLRPPDDETPPTEPFALLRWKRNRGLL